MPSCRFHYFNSSEGFYLDSFINAQLSTDAYWCQSRVSVDFLLFLYLADLASLPSTSPVHYFSCCGLQTHGTVWLEMLRLTVLLLRSKPCPGFSRVRLWRWLL